VKCWRVGWKQRSSLCCIRAEPEPIEFDREYVVLLSDYTGSTGYGEAFAQAIAAPVMPLHGASLEQLRAVGDADAALRAANRIRELLAKPPKPERRTRPMTGDLFT
jgi:hypothetical protein